MTKDTIIKDDITGIPIIETTTTTTTDCTCQSKAKKFGWLLFLVGGIVIGRVTKSK